MCAAHTELQTLLSEEGRGCEACACVHVPHAGDAQGSSLSGAACVAVLVSSVSVCLEYTMLSITTVGLAKEKGAASSLDQGWMPLAVWDGLRGLVGKVSYINNNPKLLEAVAIS